MAVSKELIRKFGNVVEELVMGHFGVAEAFARDGAEDEHNGVVFLMLQEVIKGERQSPQERHLFLARDLIKNLGEADGDNEAMHRILAQAIVGTIRFYWDEKTDAPGVEGCGLIRRLGEFDIPESFKAVVNPWVELTSGYLSLIGY